MSATKAMTKAVKGMTTLELYDTRQYIQREIDGQRNPMVRSSLQAQRSIVDAELTKRGEREGY